MYLLNKSLFSRSLCVSYFTPQPSGSKWTGQKSFNPGLQTGSPIGDNSGMNVQVDTSGVIRDFEARQAQPQTIPSGKRQAAKKATEPMTAKQLNPDSPNSMKSKLKKKKTQNKKQSNDKMIYWPRGNRPKQPEEIKFSSEVKTPEGQKFYRDGPRYGTDTERLKKLSSVRTLRQEPDMSNGGSVSLGQIRSHFQTIRPQFLPQLPSYVTGAEDSKLDTIQRDIWRTMYKQMRDVYQTHKSINTSFENVFTEEKLYLYFYDTFALYAELVCLIQMAAYYLNESGGCDNIVMSNLANTLNKTEFHDIRNDMARTLRFSYLPGELCKETYEMFQAYRVGFDVTSGTMRFVTPAMTLLIKQLSIATVHSSSDPEVMSIVRAISNYSDTMQGLMDNINHGRTGNPESQTNPPRRTIWNTAATTPVYNSFSKNEPYIFPDGRGTISYHERQQLEGYLEVVARSANIKLLDSIQEGNSQTTVDIAWSDMWNNSPLTTRQGNNVDWFWPTPIPGGTDGAESNPKWLSPKHTENTIYCSDTSSLDIQYKSVQMMLQRFTGYSSLFWVQIQDEQSCNMNRWYLIEREPKVNLHQSDDIRADFEHGHIHINTSNNTIMRALISDNYVTKMIQAGSQFYSFNNPDSQSAGQWYLTLGDLRDYQYNRGIDYLK